MTCFLCICDRRKNRLILHPRLVCFFLSCSSCAFNSREGAYAKAFQVQVSQDEVNWTDIYHTNNATGGTNELTVDGIGRYVRVLGTERALSNYGYSIIEFEVFGTGGGNEPPIT
ncbi:discoidin domain-containing protein [Paenibacillus sp. Marseille-Q4541]|uniref:discoidin domain-containing protein n=1 Tax=Paenibacillus sp. Marseille-Q4541 TaxID=2831522 RepID=UPI00201A1B2F|nr:discoidin domain-containing protein [Paenibacillus sp. Marseille-Q4541]